MASASSGRHVRVSRVQNANGLSDLERKFKLSLISEVKKYIIIWQNFVDGDKNQLLLEDAWVRVQRTLNTHNVERLKQFWNNLLRTYYYLKKGEDNISMDPVLAEAMEFMDTELGFKQPENRSEPKPFGKKAPVRRPSVRARNKDKLVHTTGHRTPKTTYAASSQAGNKKLRLLAIAVINDLYDTLPQEEAIKMTDGLLYATLQLKPNLESEIFHLAKNHYRSTGTVDDIDWTPLKTSASTKVCNAIWNLKMKESMVIRWKKEKNARKGEDDDDDD